MTSTVTRSQSNRAPLGCGGTRDSHHGCADDKSAATVWCYHDNMDQISEECFQHLVESMHEELRQLTKVGPTRYQQGVPNKWPKSILYYFLFKRSTLIAHLNKLFYVRVYKLYTTKMSMNSSHKTVCVCVVCVCVCVCGGELISLPCCELYGNYSLLYAEISLKVLLFFCVTFRNCPAKFCSFMYLMVLKVRVCRTVISTKGVTTLKWIKM